MREPVIKFISRLPRRVFTSRELAAISGKSISSVVQGLKYLNNQGIIIKVHHGIWAEPGRVPLSPFEVVPCLHSGKQLYVSFTSALHLLGMIEQIPREITCASLAHSRLIKTAVGSFSIHRIAPEFFFGFDWYDTDSSFLVATPEKALLDCCYVAGRKSRRFGHLPELTLPKTFDEKKAHSWIGKIRDQRLRKNVLTRFDSFLTGASVAD